MYCKMCGSQIPDGADVCNVCGAVQKKQNSADNSTIVSESSPIRETTAEDIFAIVSVSASIAGLFFGFIMMIVGLVFGILGRKSQKYPGFAKGGIIVSIIGIVLRIVVIIVCVVLFLGLFRYGYSTVPYRFYY